MMNPVPWLQMTNMISYQELVRTFLSAGHLRQRLHVDGGVCGHGGKLTGGLQWAKVAWKAIEQVEKDVRKSL